MFSKYFLLLFIIYLPVYVFLLFFLITKIKGYSTKSNVVSLLATAVKPWGPIFNFSTILYGLLSFAVPINLVLTLGVNTLSIFGALLLLTTGTATILVGIFPMNKSDRNHKTVNYIVFSSIIFTGLVFIPIFNLSNIFLPYMKLVNYGALGITVLHSLISHIYKRTSPVLEWSSLIGTIGWNLLLSISLFLSLRI
ncbi:MAG: DUF998 domain-containing protein [Minisyncoccia bacterium]